MAARGGAQEVISALLAQRGPQAVPYEERHKWTIRQHLSELLKMFPNLTIKVSEFHTNDGRLLNLVKAEGTIPIHYQSAKYNIPLVVWLPEHYPVSAPLAYVTPTPNMIIKAGHSCVDASGLVRSPCVSRWLHPASDLSSTLQEMAMLFGAEPPLYTKPPGYVAPPPGPAAGGYGGGVYGQQQQQQQQPLQQQQAQQQQQQQPGYPGQQGMPHQQAQAQAQRPEAALAGHTLWGAAYAAAAGVLQHVTRPHDAGGGGGGAGGAGGGSSSSTPYGAAGGGVSPVPPPPPPPPPDPKQQQVEELNSSFQGLAARALAGRLQAGLEAFNRHAAEEMDSLLDVQRQLVAREQQLQDVVSSIQQERAGTEGLVAQLGRQSAALEAWLASHEWKADAVAAALSGAGGLDVDKVVIPADALSRQALAAQAEDLAVEDTLLVLEKALLEGQLTPDAYLKQVRLLCRKQFLARALGLKVAVAQRAAPPRPRSAGSNHNAAACALTHGDTWSHR